jgi:hypothetical protein
MPSECAQGEHPVNSLPLTLLSWISTSTSTPVSSARLTSGAKTLCTSAFSLALARPKYAVSGSIVKMRILGFALSAARSAAMSLLRSNMAALSGPSVLVPGQKMDWSRKKLIARATAATGLSSTEKPSSARPSMSFVMMIRVVPSHSSDSAGLCAHNPSSLHAASFSSYSNAKAI